MSSETKFINGLIVKAPNENAPDYVKAKLSFKIDEMIATLQAKKAEGETWLNADVKAGQSGKWYAAEDTWKPNSERQAPVRQSAPIDDFADDSLPPF